jgi:uncharacterized membrane protein YgaE (UPF0421/DUF939 family)
MGAIEAIVLFLKNYKKIIVLALAGIILIVFLSMYGMIKHYQSKIDDMKADHAQAQISQYKRMMEQINLHNKRLANISAQTNKLNDSIKKLKLTKEKCQDEVFYDTANDIIDRFNSVQ